MATKPNTTRFLSPVGALFSAASIVAGLCVLTGCYERVTSATGFGANKYTVSEPYQRNGVVDDWLFGKQDPPKTSGTRIPPTPQRD